MTDLDQAYEEWGTWIRDAKTINLHEAFKAGWQAAQSNPARASLPDCDICGKPQIVLGAIGLRKAKPPYKKKVHICVDCYDIAKVVKDEILISPPDIYGVCRVDEGAIEQPLRERELVEALKLTRKHIATSDCCSSTCVRNGRHVDCGHARAIAVIDAVLSTATKEPQPSREQLVEGTADKFLTTFLR